RPAAVDGGHAEAAPGRDPAAAQRLGWTSGPPHYKTGGRGGAAARSYLRFSSKLPREATCASRRICHEKLLALLVFGLVHVLDDRLVDEQIGFALTMHLEAVAVVPLDDAANLLAIPQYQDHVGLGLHLLQEIETFGVGLVGRVRLLGQALGDRRVGGNGRSGAGQLVAHFRERGANELAVGGQLRIGGAAGGGVVQRRGHDVGSIPPAFVLTAGLRRCRPSRAPNWPTPKAETRCAVPRIGFDRVPRPHQSRAGAGAAAPTE